MELQKLSVFANLQKVGTTLRGRPRFPELHLHLSSQKFLFHVILLPEFIECFITWKLHSATNSYSYILFSCRNVANPCQAMWHSN